MPIIGRPRGICKAPLWFCAEAWCLGSLNRGCWMADPAGRAANGEKRLDFNAGAGNLPGKREREVPRGEVAA